MTLLQYKVARCLLSYDELACIVKGAQILEAEEDNIDLCYQHTLHPRQ